MTDGHMAIPVSPDLTGDEAMAFGFFKRAADAIVDASTFRKELSTLTAKFDDMEHSFGALNDVKQGLDRRVEEQIITISHLNQELSDSKVDLNDARADRDEMKDEFETERNKHGETQTSLHEARTDRDKYHLELLETQDKLSAAEAKLAKIAETFHGLGLTMPTAEPEPTPEPVPDTPTRLPQWPWNTGVEEQEERANADMIAESQAKPQREPEPEHVPDAWGRPYGDPRYGLPW